MVSGIFLLLSATLAGTKFTEELEAVDSGGVLIGEGEVHGIVADQLNVQCLDVCRHGVLIECASAGPFIAARSAWTVLSQIAEGVGADVSVIPHNFELVLSNFFECGRCCA